MTAHFASAFALRLAAFATRTGGPLPLLDGSSATLGLSGMAFLPRARQRASEAVWFRQTPTVKALADQRSQGLPGQVHPELTPWDDEPPGTGGPADQREYVLVVQWRRLLSKALLRHETTANVSPELRQLAHQAWRTLLPLVEDHDVVLFQLLTAASRNVHADPSRVTHEPLWVGFDTKEDELRFDAQVAALLASRRTEQRPFDGFCEAASRWLTDTFKAVTNTAVQRHVGLCTTSKHARGGRCDTCPEIARERRFLLALDVPALLDQRRRRLTAPPVQPSTARTPSIMRDNIRWLVDSRSRFDGTVRFEHTSGAPARFINVQRLRERWQELGMLTMFDDLPPPAQIEGSRQARAFLERVLGNATLLERSYPAQDLFVQAGWGTAEDFDTSYSQFIAVYESTLLAALRRLDQRAYALLKARAAQPVIPAHTRAARRVVTRNYSPLNGDAVIEIRVIRAMSAGRIVKNFYTLPHDIDEPVLMQATMRKGKGIKYNDQMYWTARTVNEIANKFDADNEPTYPWAREFCEWVNLQEPALADDKLFNAAIYSERLPQRLKAIADGELAHLGMFSLQEDEILKSFFFAPTTKKRLSAADWVPLLEKLPGRTERGVLKRFEELGKKYAFQYGYQAYTHSPWCRKFSAARRKQWIKEGCPQ